MSSNERSSEFYKCSICGMSFESLGDLRSHTTTEHLQKGDIPSEQKE
ncbi:MAG TPA: C2H2-type zinc finger protein [Nitrososphaeraceae archaeon]|nr:C2H2-type zinc finger protein [Nitrososphaeraceae archaeon]